MRGPDSRTQCAPHVNSRAHVLGRLGGQGGGGRVLPAAPPPAHCSAGDSRQQPGIQDVEPDAHADALIQVVTFEEVKLRRFGQEADRLIHTQY